MFALLRRLDSQFTQLTQLKLVARNLTVYKCEELKSLKQCLTATRPTSHN